MTNTPSDIPNGEGIDVEDTELSLPSLPNPWEWRSANHYGDFNGKVNIYFGFDLHETGGYLGEIDNFGRDGETIWGVHIREIKSRPNSPHGTLPDEVPETNDEFDSLEEAIENVPEIISTYYL